MQIATTEEHQILLLGQRLQLEHCASKATIQEEEANTQGLNKMVQTLLATEIEDPDPNEKALTLTAALLDAEAQVREAREELLVSLCNQIELSLGRTAFLPQQEPM